MKRRLLPIVILMSMFLVALAGTKLRAAEPSRGAKPSVTVFPVAISPGKFPDELAKRVGRVIATLLEKAGLEDLEMADTVFSPPETNDVRQIAKAFAKDVGKNPITTDCAVFAQFVGAPKTGVEAIRTIVVDKAGKVLLAESAGKEQLDKAPLRPKDPMSCCVFVGRRLQAFWGLDDPLRPNAPSGKMAHFWQKDAGIPAQKELAAIEQRLQKLKQHVKTASVTVYPVHVGRQSDPRTTANLVAALNAEGPCKAVSSTSDPALKVAGHSNEQRVLWDTARAFRDFVRKNRPATDYALYADYGLFGTAVRYVHVVICDRSGNWVLIDMQNSHHPLFEKIDPKSAASCNRLLVMRLKSRLGE